MDIKELQRNWDELGKTDPLWAILTFPHKKGNKWQVDEFFKTGVEEIKTVMKCAEGLDINFQRRKALDFGCGVGRLTQPLCEYFDEVYGVDIAPSMIELAKKYNRHGDKCRYYLNEAGDLKLFSSNSFDFIYTNITLQHMEPRYSKNYIREFLRILAPHGLLIFQLPSERTRISRLVEHITPPVLRDLYRKKIYDKRMEMYGIKREEVVKYLEESGAKIVDIKQDQSAGKGWVSFRYCVTKE